MLALCVASMARVKVQGGEGVTNEEMSTWMVETYSTETERPMIMNARTFIPTLEPITDWATPFVEKGIGTVEMNVGQFGQISCTPTSLIKEGVLGVGKPASLGGDVHIPLVFVAPTKVYPEGSA